MPFSEYQCTECASSNSIGVVSIHRVTQQLAYDEHDKCETVGDVIESQKLDTIHYQCRGCDYLTTNIADFKLVYYGD